MPVRRGSRFALEVFFLVALAVGLTVAEERAVVIAGVMALGWLLVALAEWALWREEPHYASGLPPRWYVPRVNLPPAQPLDPVVSGYPEGRRDEAPTWIASAELRREMLGDWPVAVGVTEEEEVPPVLEGTAVEVEAEVAEDAWTIVEMPPEPVLPEPPAPAAEPAPEPAVAAPPVEEPPVPPEPAVAAPPREEPVVAEALVESPPEPEPAEAASPEPEPVAADLDVELTRSAAGVARYSLDPLADPPARRFGRRREEVPSIEVPARPDGPRALPHVLEGDDA